MKLTQKKYENAKKAIEQAKAHQKVIRDWESSLKKIGNNGNGHVTVINIDDVGRLTWECKLDETEQSKKDSSKGSVE